MKARTPEEGALHHIYNPVRVYADCPVQSDRIQRARRVVSKALETMVPGGHKTIVELGCGCLDISGPFSGNHEVIGVECHADAVKKARELYPQATLSQGPLWLVNPFRADVVVLCEILEHLTYPVHLVEGWLPLAEASVISHPIDEELNSPTSGGDHCWSYSETDFKKWFELGGHNLLWHEIFQMGSYRIALGYGRRKA